MIGKKKKPVIPVKLTKKEKVSIVRKLVSNMPNYREYGFNRAVIKVFQEAYGVTIKDCDISKYLKEIEKSWQESKNILVTKQQLKDMLMRIYQNNSDTPHAQIKSLQEIGKLDGHYIEKVQHSGETSQVVIYSIPDNGRNPVKRKKRVKKNKKPPKK